MNKTLSKEDLKIRASNVAAALGYNFDSPHMDVINVKDAYCMGYTFGVKEKNEYTKQEAIGFHRWAHENHYSIYWGSDGPNCDKWYKGYTPPDRKYYTDEELYNLYQSSKEKQP